jgi:DNA sulfur modification protein DndC
MKTITIPQEVQNAQAIFVSHSGGKDSQAMLGALIRLGLKDKLVIVHSDLGEMEWEPMHKWIEANSFGLPCHVVSAELDFFDLARKYKRLPSGRQQFCTDHLKTKPITQFIHDYMSAHGITTAINATGMRAEESKRRADKKPFTLSKGDGTSGMHMPKKHPAHTIYDWMPIFDYRLDHVIKEIEACGQKMHEVYNMGFSRLSCVFCINGRVEEHAKASELRPELAQKMADLERELGKTIRLKSVRGVKMPKFLDEYLNLKRFTSDNNNQLAFC